MKQTIYSIFTSSFKAILVALVLSILIYILGVLFNWKTSLEYSNAFFIAGAIAIIAGAGSVMGGFQLRGDHRILYPQSAGDMDIEKRSDTLIKDSIHSYQTTILGAICGFVLIAISIIINTYFKN